MKKTHQDLGIAGINHLGIIVKDIKLAKSWFCDVLGAHILEDRGELVFLQFGQDILAIKTPKMAVSQPEHGGEAPGTEASGFQTLDHYGFFAPSAAAVDAFADHIRAHGAQILKGPYDRRDGRSVYFRDFCGNVGEFFFHHTDLVRCSIKS